MITASPVVQARRGMEGSLRAMVHASTDAGPRRWQRTTVAAGLILTLLGATGAPVARAEDLAELTRNWPGINTRVQAALPAIQRGIELISREPTPESADAAIVAIDAAYRYLRAAQDSASLLLSMAKYPDPARVLQKDKMWQVRATLIDGCLGIRDSIRALGAEPIAKCRATLPNAQHQLQILLAIMY